MKFVKVILGVFLMLAAALLLIGVFIPEVDEQFETRIERPIVLVFASMLNTNDLPNWIKGLEQVKRTSGILAMPGSTFELYYRSEETEVMYEVEVVEMKPLRSVKFNMNSELMDMDISIKFEADGLATIVTTYIQAKGNGLVSRSFLPLMKSVVMEEAKENLETFKQLQEQP